MTGLMSEIPDEVSFGWRGHHLYPLSTDEASVVRCLVSGHKSDSIAQRNGKHNVKFDTLLLD